MARQSRVLGLLAVTLPDRISMRCTDEKRLRHLTRQCSTAQVHYGTRDLQIYQSLL